MSLITIIVVLIVACLLYWLIQTYAPQPFKTVFIIVLVVGLCLWLLSLVGLLGDCHDIRIGH